MCFQFNSLIEHKHHGMVLTTQIQNVVSSVGDAPVRLAPNVTELVFFQLNGYIIILIFILMLTDYNVDVPGIAVQHRASLGTAITEDVLYWYQTSLSISSVYTIYSLNETLIVRNINT